MCFVEVVVEVAFWGKSSSCLFKHIHSQDKSATAVADSVPICDPLNYSIKSNSGIFPQATVKELLVFRFGTGSPEMKRNMENREEILDFSFFFYHLT